LRGFKGNRDTRERVLKEEKFPDIERNSPAPKEYPQQSREQPEKKRGTLPTRGTPEPTFQKIWGQN